MEILTREIIGFAQISNTIADIEQNIALNLARGNAAVINEISLSIASRMLTTLDQNRLIEINAAVVLDATLLAPADIAAVATQEDDDIGEGRGVLEVLTVNHGLSAQIDDTNGNASALHGKSETGIAVNYRELAPEDRPMTTENPALILQSTQTGSPGQNATLYLYYQIVRLTERELGQLSGDVRPTVLRVPNTGKPVAIRKNRW